MFQSAWGHSNEQSIANHSSRRTSLQLKCVSGTIWNWFEQPQKTKISTVANAPFIQLNSNWMTSSVDRNRKFFERIFSTAAIFKATSKLFSSQGFSDDKNCLYFSSIFFSICRFRNSIRLCFICIDNRLRQIAFFVFVKVGGVGNAWLSSHVERFWNKKVFPAVVCFFII